MAHYDINRNKNKKIRCNGQHDWGDEYLTDSEISLVLQQGEVHIKFNWIVRKKCQNKHTESFPTAKSKCQKHKTVENNSITIPVTAFSD